MRGEYSKVLIQLYNASLIASVFPIFSIFIKHPNSSYNLYLRNDCKTTSYNFHTTSRNLPCNLQASSYASHKVFFSWACRWVLGLYFVWMILTCDICWIYMDPTWEDIHQIHVVLNITPSNSSYLCFPITWAILWSRCHLNVCII